MGYNGYLIKVGNYTIPLDKISYKTYKITRNGQDRDSLHSEGGTLFRNALDNFIPKVEFELVPMLTDVEMEDILSKIRESYTNTEEQKSTASIWVPMINDYVTQSVYLPDVTFSICYADSTMCQYDKVRLAFIGYGKEN